MEHLMNCWRTSIHYFTANPKIMNNSECSQSLKGFAGAGRQRSYKIQLTKQHNYSEHRDNHPVSVANRTHWDRLITAVGLCRQMSLPTRQKHSSPTRPKGHHNTGLATAVRTGRWNHIRTSTNGWWFAGIDHHSVCITDNPARHPYGASHPHLYWLMVDIWRTNSSISNRTSSWRYHGYRCEIFQHLGHAVGIWSVHDIEWSIFNKREIWVA